MVKTNFFSRIHRLLPNETTTVGTTQIINILGCNGSSVPEQYNLSNNLNKCMCEAITSRWNVKHGLLRIRWQSQRGDHISRTVDLIHWTSHRSLGEPPTAPCLLPTADTRSGSSTKPTDNADTCDTSLYANDFTTAALCNRRDCGN